MKSKILELLGQHATALLPAVIADALNMRGDSVRKALTILRRQKKVTRAEDGTYTLSEQPASVETSATATSQS